MGEKIHIFDTSIATKNLGDLIIMDSINSALCDLFPKGRFFNSPTHDIIGKTSYALNKGCDFSFIGGTNLLSSNMNSYNQWNVNFYDAIFLKEIILLGVGWWQYQKRVNIYTKLLYKVLLNSKLQHSVRDSYTKHKLAEAGIRNCINTGCPTTWVLTKQHCEAVPVSKGDCVIFTLTDYKKDHAADSKLILSLTAAYDKVYFWPQGSSDLDYLQSLPCRLDDVEVVAPCLKAFDSILKETNSIDYVGTRLHAGIRALQYKRRSIIIGVDNRAHEMAKDISLPMLMRDEIDGLGMMIKGEWATVLSVDFDAIESWRLQFIQ